MGGQSIVLSAFPPAEGPIAGSSTGQQVKKQLAVGGWGM